MCFVLAIRNRLLPVDVSIILSSYFFSPTTHPFLPVLWKYTQNVDETVYKQINRPAPEVDARVTAPSRAGGAVKQMEGRHFIVAGAQMYAFIIST